MVQRCAACVLLHASTDVPLALVAFLTQAPKKKVASAPLAAKKAVKKETNPLYEKRPKNFGAYGSTPVNSVGLWLASINMLITASAPRGRRASNNRERTEVLALAQAATCGSVTGGSLKLLDWPVVLRVTWLLPAA